MRRFVRTVESFSRPNQLIDIINDLEDVQFEIIYRGTEQDGLVILYDVKYDVKLD